MKIILRYGDNLDIRDSVSEAEKTIIEWGEVPDEIWAEDEDGEIICEYDWTDGDTLMRV